ncbi:hypothetical protein DIE66_00055 [Mycoplasmopsis arginini]|uniref:hypothetical protein n=1 Tax=Mycoplasmopsis arginini TaxID=2094 RepID=UPI000D61CD58|nr:hypothetical protein [Mycoplasmopsis arginini]PWC09153.1 hypothetical protein DIE66_00055 [Mycoplasmopsis arginini]
MIFFVASTIALSNLSLTILYLSSVNLDAKSSADFLASSYSFFDLSKEPSLMSICCLSFLTSSIALLKFSICLS